MVNDREHAVIQVPPTHRLNKYGLSREDFKVLLGHHHDRCAICRRRFTLKRVPHVDHNHATGEARGLLCNHCNQMLGYLHDNAEWCLSAGHYLSDPPSREVFDTPRRHIDSPPTPKETQP